MVALLTAYLAFLFLIWLVLTVSGIRGLARKRQRQGPGFKGKPKILLMIPCKGTDIELERNLRSAMSQNYPNYKALAIVGSTNDPAFRSIKRSGIDYMISNFNCRECSGKVKNLSGAISRFRNFDAYCILDSDTNPASDWLSKLAGALDKKTGIATMYPEFNPLGGFWSEAKHIWALVGLGLMENPRTRFGCGASLLFRKELMENGGFEKFSESLSDDIAITNLCKARGLSIAYVPEARATTDCRESAGSFMEWSNRQTAFSVLGNRNILYVGLVYYSANALLLVSAVGLSILYSPLLVVLLLPFALSVARSYRLSGRSYPSTLPICLVLVFVYLYNMVNSVFMRRIAWRGRAYTLR